MIFGIIIRKLHALEHTSVRLWASKARFLIADHVSGRQGRDATGAGAVKVRGAGDPLRGLPEDTLREDKRMLTAMEGMDDEASPELPKFQQDAVSVLLQTIEERGGAMLADSTGLRPDSQTASERTGIKIEGDNKWKTIIQAAAQGEH